MIAKSLNIGGTTAILYILLLSSLGCSKTVKSLKINAQIESSVTPAGAGPGPEENNDSLDSSLTNQKASIEITTLADGSFFSSQEIDDGFKLKIHNVSQSATTCLVFPNIESKKRCFHPDLTRNDAHFNALSAGSFSDQYDASLSRWVFTFSQEIAFRFKGSTISYHVYDPLKEESVSHAHLTYGFADGSTFVFDSSIVRASPGPSGRTNGILTTITEEDGKIYASGWACVVGSSKSIRVQLYVSTETTAGGVNARSPIIENLIGSGVADGFSTLGIADRCGDLVTGHIFKIELFESARSRAGTVSAFAIYPQRHPSDGFARLMAGFGSKVLPN